ncbi:hypothetical protein [Antarctobacter sp.]|nr:hypothetical protein [Antarctobacter sp.]
MQLSVLDRDLTAPPDNPTDTSSLRAQWEAERLQTDHRAVGTARRPT